MKISLERVIRWVPFLRDVVGSFTHNLIESDFKIIREGFLSELSVR